MLLQTRKRGDALFSYFGLTSCQAFAGSHLMGNESGFLLYSISSVSVFLTANNATIMLPKGVQEVSGLWRNGPQYPVLPKKDARSHPLLPM